MANKNEKPINYGNLSRFYQNLKNKDLNGIATEQYVDAELSEKENKIDFTIGLNQATPGAMPTLDLSNLDDVTTDGIYNIAIISDVFGTGNEYFGTGKLIIQNLGTGNGIQQELFISTNYGLPKQEIISRVSYDGSEWEEQSYPCALIVPQGYEQVVPYATYSAAKINELINAYEIPVASSSTLGGVKVGESLEINNGVLSLNHNLMKSIYDLLPEKEHYLTFEADEDNCDIYFCNWTSTSSDFRTVYVSKDLVNWTAKKSSKGTPTSNGTLLATLNKGEKLFVKGNNNDYSPGNGNIFAPRKKCMIYGNLLSIVSESDFDKIDTLTGGFRAMFSNNDNIINHPTKKIIISLKNYNASEYNGFYGMFRNCHSLTKSPIILNIENINAPYCFGEMFQGCTSLSDTEGINISNISSISGSYAFARMFQGCTSLTNIPQNTMPSVTSNYCGYNMFQGCTSLTTASELPATTLASNCYSNMFYGCTSLTAAPELPATTLVSSCYESMFKGCSNLNYIKCLATDISASQCTREWLNNVSSTGTFVTPQSTNWTTDISGIPSGWTRVDYVEEPSAE